MSNPQTTVETDLKGAMKAADKERVATLRMLLSEVKNERIRRGSEVDEAAFVGLVRKAIKQRHEASEQFRKGARPELADKEEREAAILAAYLPQQVSEDEVRKAIVAFAAAEGLSGPAAMGPVMKAMLARFGALADGATVSRLAKEVLAGPRP